MPILALHGFTGRGSDFRPLAQACGGDWHCPDLPGHGPNPQLDCSPEMTVACINQALSTLHSPPKILLGYSMGARAALLHASQHPEAWQALILISPNPGIEDEAMRADRREADNALAKRIKDHGTPSFLEFWQETPLIRAQKNSPTELRSAMQKSRLEHTSDGLANSLRQFGQGTTPNLWPKMKTLSMPICIITGELDKKYTQIGERITEECTTSSLRVLPNLSHAPQIEAPERVASIIQESLVNLR